jgi:hypothetical protein
MNRAQLARLRVTSLALLLPGLAGLVLSTVLSTHYLSTLPTSPAPEELRMTPRNIDGRVVYQTEEENRRLNAMEYSSVGVFVAGLLMGLVYLEKWSSVRAREIEEESLTSDAS